MGHTAPVIVSSALEDTAAARKARGAFFTPPNLARFVVQWALRTPLDNVLEPSCGEAAFLLAAAEQVSELADRQPALTGLDADPALAAARGHLDGVELHEPSAQRAEVLLRAAGHRSNVEPGDFFDVEPTGTYDAVVGNPPYVRFQDFAGDARARSRKAALRAQVPISDLASSWAAFTVHAALFCRPGGRLGLVLPAELLSVNYASGVRRFLMERFSTVRLVLFTERVFPGVLEEVVLLLADGYQQGPAEHCELVQARNAEELVDARPTTAVRPGSGSGAGGPAVRTWTPDPIDGKWTTSLMPGDALEDYKTVLDAGAFTGLQSWGETTLGMVTGNNKYFALTRARAHELGLEPEELLPLSPPGSRHLRGLRYAAAAHTELTWRGSATLLFRPPDEPSPAAMDYIRAGEDDQVHQAYKCRVRKPWWRVPLLPPADMLLTCMNADTPRLTTNLARVHHLNSVHGVYLRPEHREAGMELLPLAALNSMTLLGAETVGRSYGGGMLKLEPKEADLLPVPTPATVAAAAANLRAVSPQVAAKLRNPRGLLDAVRLVDEALLIDHLQLRRPQVRALRDAHAELAARRAARGKPAR